MNRNSMNPSITEILDINFDLYEVLFHLDNMVVFIEHLEKHLVWPEMVELKKAAFIEDVKQRHSVQESIEYKYRDLIPTRQRYAYVTQFCSFLEWSFKKIMKYHNISYGKTRFRGFLPKLQRELKINISNSEDINTIYKFRNQVVHSNGMVEHSDIEKWHKTSLYELEKSFNENYLRLNVENFVQCLSETRGWLIEAISKSPSL